MSEEEQKYFKGLIGFTFDSDDIKYIEKIIDKKDKEIERLTELCNKYEEEHKTTFEEWKKTINIINEINSIVEYWGYDKEQNDISSFRMAMKSIKDILGSDKE